MNQPDLVTVPVLRGARFDASETRFVVPTQDGFACYRKLTQNNREWRGLLVGFASSEEQINAFLAGDESVSLRKR